jgi:hypothetical protein
MTTEREPDDAAPDPVPPADRDPDAMGAEWVDPDDAAEQMEDETEGRS